MDAGYEEYVILYGGCKLKTLEKVMVDKQMSAGKPGVRINALLLAACQNGYDDLATRLLQEKAAVVNTKFEAKSALMWAMLSRNKNESNVKKMVHVLVQHHANVNARDSNGATPFMVACGKGYADVAKYLLELLCLDAVDYKGCSALFYAITNKRPDIVKLLIEAGADQAIPNNMGCTPAKWAARCGFSNMVKDMEQTNKLWFGTLPEHVPNLLQQLQVAEYFEEVCSILQLLKLEDQIKHFAKCRISYYNLLIMNHQKLKRIGMSSYKKRSRLLKYIKFYNNLHLPLEADEPIESFELVGNESLNIILSKLNDYQHKLLTKQAAIKYALENRKRKELFSISKTKWYESKYYQLKMKRQEFNQYIKQLNDGRLLPNTCLGSNVEQAALDVLPADAIGYSHFELVAVNVVVFLAMFVAYALFMYCVWYT